jgi:hypothetical protein
MALFGGGRERTEAELRDLLASAGWRIAAVTPTPVAAVIVATVAEPGAEPGLGGSTRTSHSSRSAIRLSCIEEKQRAQVSQCHHP